MVFTFRWKLFKEWCNNLFCFKLSRSTKHQKLHHLQPFKLIMKIFVCQLENVWWGTYFFKTLLGEYASKVVWKLQIQHRLRPWETQVGNSADGLALTLQKEGQGTDSRCLAYKYIFVKQMNISGFSFSLRFLSQHDLEQFASLLKVSNLLEILGERNAVSSGHITPEGTENILRSMAIQILLRNLSDSRLFVFYSIAEHSTFKYVFDS